MVEWIISDGLTDFPGPQRFAGVADVTVVYAPTQRAKTLLGSWLMGEQGDLRIHVRVEPVSRALLEGDYETDAETIARKAMAVAADVCVFTNGNVTLETV